MILDLVLAAWLLYVGVTFRVESDNALALMFFHVLYKVGPVTAAFFLALRHGLFLQGLAV
jgi:hypothetical protein